MVLAVCFSLFAVNVSAKESRYRPNDPKGKVDPQGEVGPQGETGQRGKRGKKGQQDPAGPQGLGGPAGADGLAGAVGPQGPSGSAGLISYYPQVNRFSTAQQLGGKIYSLAQCDTGDIAVGGGCTLSGTPGFKGYMVISSVPGEAGIFSCIAQCIGFVDADGMFQSACAATPMVATASCLSVD